MNLDELLSLTKTITPEEREDELRLLRILARVPSPSHLETARAFLISDWLITSGATHVRIDDEKNVLCLLEHPADPATGTESRDASSADAASSPDAVCAADGNARPKRDLIVFAAHTDIVFDDIERLPLHEDAERIYAPGVGDNVANLVNLLMATRHLLRNPDLLARATRRHDILVVANSCEEGLGNLAGTRALFDETHGRISGFVTFDLYMPQVISGAVGSERWRLGVRTTGGHSYHDFGRPNAIERLCHVIGDLYASDLPVDPATGAHTTVNVGKIRGGTTVNSIASEAAAMVEYRSESSENLAIMRGRLHQIVDSHRVEAGVDEIDVAISLKAIGLRPGRGKFASSAHDAEDRLEHLARKLVRALTGCEPDRTPASTDANIPLSLGVPALCVGTVRGALLHTRDEWIEKKSLRAGLSLVLALMLGADDVL